MLFPLKDVFLTSIVFSVFAMTIQICNATRYDIFVESPKNEVIIDAAFWYDSCSVFTFNRNINFRLRLRASFLKFFL